MVPSLSSASWMKRRINGHFLEETLFCLGQLWWAASNEVGDGEQRTHPLVVAKAVGGFPSMLLLQVCSCAYSRVHEFDFPAPLYQDRVQCGKPISHFLVSASRFVDVCLPGSAERLHGPLWNCTVASRMMQIGQDGQVFWGTDPESAWIPWFFGVLFLDIPRYGVSIFRNHHPTKTPLTCAKGRLGGCSQGKATARCPSMLDLAAEKLVLFRPNRNFDPFPIWKQEWCKLHRPWLLTVNRDLVQSPLRCSKVIHCTTCHHSRGADWAASALSSVAGLVLSSGWGKADWSGNGLNHGGTRRSAMSQTSLIILKSVPSRSSTGMTVIGNMRRHRDIMNFVILCYLVNSSNCPHVTWMRIPWLFPMLWSSNASVLGSPAKMTIRRTLRWIWIRNGRHRHGSKRI